MAELIECINRMTGDDKVKLMEYLWLAMTNAAEPESPTWHQRILAERRRRVECGEEEFLTIAESKRRLKEVSCAC